ncbi:hypothetical protein [Aeromicrobium sp. 179-A 4D2 NHS]|uniref:hypothetical protein n=1 Tax=Aeromicrobium sp. 179-A 4D2 NHS TaxID=3142375 RepID=UPI0039A20D0C
MATKKTTTDEWTLGDMLRKSAEEWEANNVKREFAIAEVTPSQHQSGTHGGSWTDKQSRLVSPAFDTEEEALEWAKGYRPDEGNYFAMTTIDHQQTIRRHVFVGRTPLVVED